MSESTVNTTSTPPVNPFSDINWADLIGQFDDSDDDSSDSNSSATAILEAATGLSEATTSAPIPAAPQEPDAQAEPSEDTEACKTPLSPPMSVIRAALTEWGEAIPTDDRVYTADRIFLPEKVIRVMRFPSIPPTILEREEPEDKSNECETVKGANDASQGSGSCSLSTGQ